MCCRNQKRWGKTGRRGWRPEQGKNAQVAAGRSPFTSEQACCLHRGCNRRPSGLNLHSQGGPATRDIRRQQVSGRSLWLWERTCLFDAASLFNLPKHEFKLSNPRVVAVRVMAEEIHVLCFLLVIEIYLTTLSWGQTIGLFEGCLTMQIPHEIKWNANLMQLGNFIDVFLARHVSGTYARHQEH